MRDSYIKGLAARLRAARKAAGYATARAFSQAHNTPESTYSQRETGKRPLNIDNLLEYSEKFGVNPAWLLAGIGSAYAAPHAHREAIIAQELQDLQGSHVCSTPAKEITKDGTMMVNVKLFCDILRELSPTLVDGALPISKEELIDFCIDIYNRIIATTTDDMSQKTMIQLSVTSLHRGIGPGVKPLKTTQA